MGYRAQLLPMTYHADKTYSRERMPSERNDKRSGRTNGEILYRYACIRTRVELARSRDSGVEARVHSVALNRDS